MSKEKKEKKDKKKSKLRLKIEAIREKRAQNDVENMTDEQRQQHEKYIRELTAQNQRTVGKVGTVLWCLAMIGWTIFLVLEIVLYGSPLKILFYSVGCALTALLALNRVLDFFAARKEKGQTSDEDTEA